MKKQNTKDTHIYFPVAMYDRIKKLAARERHTISVEIVIAVENHLKANGGKK